MEASQVKELFDYDPETGVLRWRVNSGRARTGAVAGTRGNGGRYIVVRYEKKYFLGHRLAFAWMEGRWPDPTSDHENGNGLDNRWMNLREASYRENAQNRKTANTNVLGFKGVIRRKGQQFRHAPYEAYIRAAGDRVYLGRFQTAQEAAAAYATAAKTLHKAFSRT